MTVKADRVC